MKIRVIITSLVASMAVFGAVAQDVEQDDMYFNSKDRAKLQAQRKISESVAFASIKTAKKSEMEEETSNPTDSYSARNVNPEFTSRSKSKAAKEDEENYFVYNYRNNTRNNYNNWNNGFNNWYGSSWYRPNYYASSIYGWNSPYYGYYDSWNSPWYDPYWSYNGWSSSFSYYHGNAWNYGWGGSYNYWNRPYCAGNSYYGYGSGFGYGSNWYWNNYRPTVVVINNNTEAGRNVSYGKRPTRGSSVVYDHNNRSRSSSSIGSNGRGDVSGGRVSNSSNGHTEYYNRSWKNTSNNSSYDSRSSTQQNRASSWGGNGNSWNNNNSSYNRSNSTYTPSNNNSNSSFNSGGTRSHSSTPSSGSSGSNGRSRGRD